MKGPQFSTGSHSALPLEPRPSPWRRCPLALAALTGLFWGCASPSGSPPGAEHREITVGVGPTAIAAIKGWVLVGEIALDFGNLTYGEGSVAWLDPSSESVVRRSAVGTNPQVIVAAGRSRDKVAVICTGDYAAIPGQIDVLTAIDGTHEHRIELGGTPGSAAAGHSDTLYVGSYSHPGVAIVDVGSGAILEPWSSAAGFHADGLAVANNEVYAVDFGADLLLRLQPDGSVFDAIPVGDGPISVYPDPTDPNRVFVLHSLEETVGAVALDSREFARLGPPTGRAPNHLLAPAPLEDETPHTLWVVSSLSNLLEARSPSNGALVQSFFLGPNRNPMQVCILEKRAWVSNLLANSVSVVDFGRPPS